MTWKELKRSVRMKIDEPSEEVFEKEYLPKMYDAANQAMLKLATTVAQKIKIERLNVRKLPNMATNTKFRREASDIEMSFPFFRGITFECDGTGTCYISQDGVPLEQVDMESDGQYIRYTATTPQNTEDDTVDVLFTGDLAYSVRNLGIYPYLFSDDVPDAAPAQRYDMNKITDDFLAFAEKHPVLVDGIPVNTEFYSVLSESEIAFEREGLYEVCYVAYPQRITENTSDDAKIDMPDDMVHLMAFYIASEIYLGNDKSVSVILRNKFDAELAQCVRSNPIQTELEDTHGWLA